MTAKKDEPTEFEKAAREPEGSMFTEFAGFLRENRKWWLWPIMIIFLLLGALVFLSGTGFAPFVYTFF